MNGGIIDSVAGLHLVGYFNRANQFIFEPHLYVAEVVNVFDTAYKPSSTFTLRVFQVSQSPFLLSHPSNFYHPLNFLKLPHIRSRFYIRTTSFKKLPTISLTNTPYCHFSTPSTSHRNPSHTPEFLPSMCCIYFRFVSSSCCRIFIFSVIPRRICSRRGQRGFGVSGV